MTTSTLRHPTSTPAWTTLAGGLIWLALMLFGGLGIASRLVNGHADANYGSYIVWGLWIAAYIFFIGLSAGAFLMSSLVYVGSVHRLERIGKVALFVALITLFMALLSVVFDLGHMWRAFYVFTRPNFQSMMAWMIWLYTAYFLLLLAELYLAMRGDMGRAARGTGLRARVSRLLLFGRPAPDAAAEARDRRILRRLAIVGVPLAVAFHGGVGALFGTVSARPYWHTPLYPILFLTGALVSGGALILAVVAFLWPAHLRDASFHDIVRLLGRFVLAMLAVDVLLEFAEFSIPSWYAVGPENDLVRQVLFGEYWWVFWVLHVALGTVVPAFLLLRFPGSRVHAGIAGALIAVTFMAVRLNLVVPGLIQPQLSGLEDAYQDPRLLFSYMPSLAEWQVVVFLVAAGTAVFYLGHRLLPLFDSGEPAA